VVLLHSNTGALVGMIHLEPGRAPALWPLQTIGGVEVTRAFPFRSDRAGEAHDHPHHRSMWAAHGDVNGVDFWHGEGRIEHDAVRDGMRLVSGGQWIEGRWLDGQGRAMLRSRTSFHAFDVEGVRSVSMQVILEAIDRPVVFGDTKEGTMALRLAPHLRLTGAVATGTLANSVGVSGAGVWGKDAKWIEVTGQVDGHAVQLKFLSMMYVEPTGGPWPPLKVIPQSVRWHARPYGLIAANPFGERAFVGSGAAVKATRLEVGERLVMALLVELRDGQGSRDEQSNR